MPVDGLLAPPSIGQLLTRILHHQFFIKFCCVYYTTVLQNMQMFCATAFWNGKQEKAFNVKSTWHTATKQFPKKQTRNCNAIQTYRKSNSAVGVKLQALQFATFHAETLTALLVKNHFKKSKYTTATQFRPSAKETFPPWGLVTCIEVCNFSRKNVNRTACKKPFQNKEKHDCNAIQT